MKYCNTCKTNKSTTKFYKANNTRDKLRTKCIDCMALYSKGYGKTHRVKITIRNRKWREDNPARAKANSRNQFLKHKEKRYAYSKSFFNKFPEKRKAINAVNNAIAAGRLKRKPCFCGKKGEAHHSDYSKPLKVIWRCSSHHKRLHVKINHGTK